VGQAYEGRARTFANLGRTADAEADYEALIRFDLTWPVDRTRNSPKILALYDGVRKRLVGTLVVQTDPPGARLKLGEEILGRSPLFDKELLAGSYSLSAEAEGFEPLVEPLTVTGGARLEKTLRLIPNARDVIVTTSPSGAKVSVDGKERGVTFGEAGQEYSGAAAEMGLALSEISAPILIEHLSPGNHQIRIEKACYEPQLLAVEVAVDSVDNSPVRFAPTRLAPSKGSLFVESVPVGAEVSLDGTVAGATPATLDQVCSGWHDVVLRKKDVGQWRGRVEVTRGERGVLKATLRPTLAYVGVMAAGAGAAPPAGEQDLGQLLSRLRGMNVLGPGAGLPDDLLARRRKDPEAPMTRADLAAVAAATGADLVLAARPAEGAFERKLEIHILSTKYALQDRGEISLEDEGAKDALLARLESRTNLDAPWLGLSVIERYQNVNPTVVRVLPGSPALAAGVKVGDRIVSVAGTQVHAPADLLAATAKLPRPGQASLIVQGPGAAPRSLNIAVGATMLVPNPRAPSLSKPLLAAELSYRAAMEAAAGRPTGPERTASLLGLGALLLDAGLYDQALHDALDLAALPPGPGISDGTLAYLRGLCLQAAGRGPEGRQMLEKAAGQSEATLWSNDGPSVKELAQRRLSSHSSPATPPGR
ncbi:MAG TPA: PEGA domain-containing protein, partial [Candidatus Polarisedimenticolia bacterium]|nr:PEGA domain-containing protein [Candidatus Polarisedimenticolia bacterium]